MADEADEAQRRFRTSTLSSTSPPAQAPWAFVGGLLFGAVLSYGAVGMFLSLRNANIRLSKAKLPNLTLREHFQCLRQVHKTCTAEQNFSPTREQVIKLYHQNILKTSEAKLDRHAGENAEEVLDNAERSAEEMAEKIKSRGWVREGEKDSSQTKKPVEPPFGLGVTGQERELRRMAPANRRMYETAKRMDNQLYRLKNDAKKADKK